MKQQVGRNNVYVTKCLDISQQINQEVNAKECSKCFLKSQSQIVIFSNLRHVRILQVTSTKQVKERELCVDIEMKSKKRNILILLFFS